MAKKLTAVGPPTIGKVAEELVWLVFFRVMVVMVDLVGGLEHEFFIFPNSWDDDPIRLSYFSGGWNHQLVLITSDWVMGRFINLQLWAPPIKLWLIEDFGSHFYGHEIITMNTAIESGNLWHIYIYIHIHTYTNYDNEYMTICVCI